jgi:hypothetical protein
VRIAEEAHGRGFSLIEHHVDDVGWGFTASIFRQRALRLLDFRV